ncbi:MAG: hypothetical protein WC629_02380 [Candidatus Paceibacterota bacterium]|jgi:hypothetical protein
MIRHHLLKIIVAGIIVVVIALAAGFMINYKTASAPIPANISGTSTQNIDQNVGQFLVTSIQAPSPLDKITATSKVSVDIDTYLNSSSNVSNPNDFNDSYADLNQ